MPIRPRRIAIVLALCLGGLAVMGLALTASAAPAAPHAIRNYPDPLNPSGPCNTTLQACIDGSNPGDEIRIRDGLYITSAVLTKTLSLVGFGEGLTFIQPPPGERGLTISGNVTEAAEIAHFTVQNAVRGAGNGGGILVLAPARPTLHHLTVQSSTVTQSGAQGGGLFIETTITVTHLTLRNNSAPVNGRGGGLGVSFPAHITVLDSVFIGNRAGSLPTNTTASHGGGLYAAGPATVINSVFQDNRAITGSAGALFAGGNLFLSGSAFTGSTAHDSGGAIFATGPLTMYNSLVAQSVSTGGSGAGVRAASTAVISNSQFISNTAFNPGGGLRTSLNVALFNTDFISNTSGGSGGGLRANANAAVTGGSFIANTATAGGGALVPGTATVMNVLFRGNQGSTRGGGLDVVTATVQASVFENNVVPVGNGGGLYAVSVLTLTDSVFTANRVLSGTPASSTGNGGGLFSDGLLFSQGNRYLHNFAFVLGGGADVDDVVSRNDEFRGNTTAPQGSGGGMFVAGVMDLDGGLFYTNTAHTAGGLGINSTASGVVLNSLFAGNTVTFTNGGAAIRLLSTTAITVTHNTLVGNNASNRAAIELVNAGQRWFINNIFTQYAIGIRNSTGVTATEQSNLFFANGVDLAGAFDSFASFSVDPRFRDPAAGDYRLSATSQALDTGLDTGLDHDFEGQPRPMGGSPDVGFDEALPPRVWMPLILK